MEESTITSEQFKSAMSSFAAGVTIITTIDSHGVPQAMTATAFSSVSMSPPLCLVCIDRRARTHHPVLLKGCFAVNILNADQQSLSARFASRVPDKFAGVLWRHGDVTGCPIIEGALAWLECKVSEVHSGGDHDIFLGQIFAVQVNDGSPLIYFRGSYSSLPPPADQISDIGLVRGRKTG
jgi:flavin reductase (DIM6/NTAB) family NADH-FMN oxidoreductase RutF